jgi:hypothetical protein
MDADFGDEGFMEEPFMSGMPQQWQGTVQATQVYPPGTSSQTNRRRQQRLLALLVCS